MIPKIFHYCWFGEKEIPTIYLQYIEEWSRINPDFKVIKWDESNSPMNLDYMKKAHKNKKWANLSNLARFYALTKHGGIYLDTDVKIIKPLHSLLNDKCFLGFEEGENQHFWVNNAIIGSTKNHAFVKRIFQKIQDDFDGTEAANESAPRIVTKILKEEWGLKSYGHQQLKDITLYPTSWFYPVHYSEVYKLKELEKHILPETLAVHMWGRSWLSETDLLNMYDDLQKEHKRISEEYISSKSKINDFSEKIEYYKIKLSDKESDILKSISDKFSFLDKTLHEFKTESAKQNEQQQALLEKNSRLKDDINQLSLQLKIIKTNEYHLSQQLELERSRLTEKESLMKQLEEQIQNNEFFLSNQIMHFKQLNDKLKKSIATKDQLTLEKITGLEKELSENIADKKQLWKTELELTECKKEIDVLLKNIQHLQLELQDYNSDKTKLLETENALDDLKKLYQNQNEIIGRYEHTIVTTNALHEDLWKKYRELDSSEKNKTKEIIELKRNLDTKEAQLKNQEKAINWYSQTYHNRRLIGIIKDRFKQARFAQILTSIFKRKKEFKAKQKPRLNSEIFCAIVNHNYNENAKKLRATFSKYLNTAIFDSGSKVVDKSFIDLGNVYYSGLLNAAFNYAKERDYKYLFFICSDVECDDQNFERLIKNLEKIDLSTIGVYSPASSGRCHAYCKKMEDQGMRTVPFVEGFIFIANLKVLSHICPINTEINLYGWGLDVAKGYFCRKEKLLCLIDDEIEVFHPGDTGYSTELADRDMWRWVETFKDHEFKNFYTKQIDIIRLGEAAKNKVSIIVPCYNQADYLNETIYNILLQEHGNIEVLLVDDGSTDQTPQICKKFSQIFSSVKYIPKKNGGLGSARNEGLKNAKGSFIQFLDSDDLLSSNKIVEQIYTYIKNPKIDITYTEYLCFEDGIPEKTWTYSRVILKEDPLLDLIEKWETELSIPVHCFLYKKEILANLYFDEALPNHEDWEFHIKVAAKRPTYTFVNRGIAFYRVRSNSMARDNSLMLTGKKMCLQKVKETTKLSEKYHQALENRLNEN